MERSQSKSKGEPVKYTQFTGVKVFSTTSRFKDELGDRVTEWVRANNVQMVDTVITQSSDCSFHCLTITLFYK